MFENGLAIGRHPIRAQRCALLLLLLLSSLILLPRWAGGKWYLSGISFVSWFNPVDCTWPQGILQSFFRNKRLQIEMASPRKMLCSLQGLSMEIPEESSDSRKVRVWRERSLNSRLWALFLTYSSSCHSLKLGGRAMGQNMVNMRIRVWSQAAQIQIPDLPLTPYLPCLLCNLR